MDVNTSKTQFQNAVHIHTTPLKHNSSYVSIHTKYLQQNTAKNYFQIK